MRIFLAGATGALGTQLVPALLARGHDVTGMTRRRRRPDGLRAAGADARVADALDRDAVVAAVTAARPDAVVHQLTALAGLKSLRDFDGAFARHEPAADRGHRDPARRRRAPPARAASWRSRSRAGRRSAAAGPSRRRTTRSTPTRSRRCARRTPRSGAARRSSRRPRGSTGSRSATAGSTARAPGSPPGGEQLEMVHKRALPRRRRRRRRLVVHPHRRRGRRDRRGDRARRARRVQRHGRRPRAGARLAPRARRRGRARRRRATSRAGSARLAAGAAVVAMMTEIRGASNAKARRELHWTPAHPTWREGFRTVLG